MAGVIRYRGQNIDNMLEPRTTAKISNLGIRRNGVDITNAFERASSGTPAGNIGLLKNGQQVGPMFAARGGVTYWDGTLSPLPQSSFNHGNGLEPGLVEFQFHPNGEIRQRLNYPVRDILIGRWDGSVADSGNTSIQVVIISGSLFTNNAVSMVSLDELRQFSTQVGPIPGGDLEEQSATVEVRLQQSGDASTREIKTISMSATYGGGIG